MYALSLQSATLPVDAAHFMEDKCLFNAVVIWIMKVTWSCVLTPRGRRNLLLLFLFVPLGA
jgi:hypothetical protein